MIQTFPILDMHCDTASLLLEIKGGSLYHNDGMVSIQKLRQGGVFCQFFAMFIHMTNFTSPDAAYEYLLKMHGNLIQEFEINSEHIALVRSASDVSLLHKTGKIAAFLGVEEGGVIDNNLKRLDCFYDMGVRLITLTWNHENCIGFPNSFDSNIMSRGLKPFGFEVIDKMQDMGMIIDVSHLSDGGFWDIIKHCKKPFAASHSNARELCNHPRNLTDDMLKALANAGGVTGLNLFHMFLGSDNTGSVDQMTAHIKHIHNTAGIDVLALGCDFDGFDGPCGILNCAEFYILIEALLKAGFRESEIEKICWKNAMRVIEDVL